MTQTTEDTVILPTGEAVSVHDEHALAKAYAELSETVRRDQDTLAALRDHLVHFARIKGGSSFNTQAGLVSVVRRNRYKWHPERLGRLVDAGLPPERYDELVRFEPRVSATVANQITKSNPEYGSIIEDAREVHTSYDVRVA